MYPIPKSPGASNILNAGAELSRQNEPQEEPVVNRANQQQHAPVNPQLAHGDPIDQFFASLLHISQRHRSAFTETLRQPNRR
jgi:hypothetical protein